MDVFDESVRLQAGLKQYAARKFSRMTIEPGPARTTARYPISAELWVLPSQTNSTFTDITDATRESRLTVFDDAVSRMHRTINLDFFVFPGDYPVNFRDGMSNELRKYYDGQNALSSSNTTFLDGVAFSTQYRGLDSEMNKEHLASINTILPKGRAYQELSTAEKVSAVQLYHLSIAQYMVFLQYATAERSH